VHVLADISVLVIREYIESACAPVVSSPVLFKLTVTEMTK